MLVVLLVALVALAFPAPPLVTSAHADASCYHPLCTDRDWPDYAYRDGVESTGPYGVCNSHSGLLAPASHILKHCPPGTSLVAGAGLCHDDACGGAGCEERSICTTDARYPQYWVGHDGHDASGPTADCNSLSTAPAPESHISLHCPAGFNLVAGVGVCERCPLVMAPGGIRTPVGGPDLVLRNAYLRTRTSAAHVTTLRRGTAYYACFTAANIGVVNSANFRVGGGGLGVTPPFQDHAGLAAGASRDGCLTYPTTPPPGTYRLMLSADSLHAVGEMHEDNNDATLTLTVIP
jgi:hypothetical protein